MKKKTNLTNEEKMMALATMKALSDYRKYNYWRGFKVACFLFLPILVVINLLVVKFLE